MINGIIKQSKKFLYTFLFQGMKVGIYFIVQETEHLLCAHNDGWHLGNLSEQNRQRHQASSIKLTEERRQILNGKSDQHTIQKVKW